MGGTVELRTYEFISCLEGWFVRWSSAVCSYRSGQRERTLDACICMYSRGLFKVATFLRRKRWDGLLLLEVPHLAWSHRSERKMDAVVGRDSIGRMSDR